MWMLGSQVKCNSSLIFYQLHKTLKAVSEFTWSSLAEAHHYSGKHLYWPCSWMPISERAYLLWTWLFCKLLINYRKYVYQPYYEVLLKECSEFKTSLTAAFVTSCWLPQKAILLMHYEEARNENSFKEVHLENWYIFHDGRPFFFFIDFQIMGCWRKEEQENQNASVRVLRSTQRDLMKQKCVIIHF